MPSINVIANQITIANAPTAISLRWVSQDWQGVWLSSLVFLPLAIFLTTKANSDSKLFDADFYNRILRNIGQLFSKQAKS